MVTVGRKELNRSFPVIINRSLTDGLVNIAKLFTRGPEIMVDITASHNTSRPAQRLTPRSSVYVLLRRFLFFCLQFLPTQI